MQELKQLGLKVTAPRVMVLEFLKKSNKIHFSAEEVYTKIKEEGKDIGLATIYRVLAQFEKSGILLKNSFEGGIAIYELSNEQHHDHMFCLKCNKIFEFYNQELEELQRKIAKELNFNMTNHDMTLYGKCENCK